MPVDEVGIGIDDRAGAIFYWYVFGYPIDAIVSGIFRFWSRSLGCDTISFRCPLFFHDTSILFLKCSLRKGRAPRPVSEIGPGTGVPGDWLSGGSTIRHSSKLPTMSLAVCPGPSLPLLPLFPVLGLCGTDCSDTDLSARYQLDLTPILAIADEFRLSQALIFIPLFGLVGFLSFADYRPSDPAVVPVSVYIYCGSSRFNGVYINR